ncbi:hypothetical protein J6590_108499 [Homalodisca vitripennis]|nr:hypothetical protein J6590_108499 [Homalodisca vitripennis]
MELGTTKKKCNESVSLLKSYLNNRNLLLNDNKTTFIQFTCKNVESNKINMKNLAKETKFLGLHLDNTLNWNIHVQKICNKIGSGIFALRRLAPFCNKQTMKSVYYATVHSHIAYGIEVYGGTSAVNLNKILRLQKEAIRVILKLKKDESCKLYFKELEFMTVYSLYIYRTVLYVKNNETKLPRQLHVHDYNTRNKNNFVIKQHNKEKFKQSPTYMGIKFMGNLPGSIRNENNSVRFKNKLKQFLIDLSCYNFEEFYSQSHVF